MNSIKARMFATLAWGAMCAVAGCASNGAMTARDLKQEYRATELKAVQIGGLAKMGLPTEKEHRIRPGERLEISCADLFEEIKTETFSVRVANDGSVELPLLARRLVLQSLTCAEAEQIARIEYISTNLIHQPQIIIRPLEPKKRAVYVIGAVKKPGVYELLEPDECDPLRAILAAGGLTDDAGGVVEVRRASAAAANNPSPPSGIPADTASAPSVRNANKINAPRSNETQLELTAPSTKDPGIVQTGSASALSDGAARHLGAGVVRFDFASEDFQPTPEQLELKNGDVVSVEERKKHPFFVTGSVNKAGDFPMPKGREIHVLEAIGMAGGVDTMSEPTLAVVVRRFEGKEPVAIRVDLARAARDPQENIALMTGDLVNVQEDTASQSRRFVREFLRLGLYSPLTLMK